MKADNNSPPPILLQMNTPIAIHTPTGNTNSTRVETHVPSSPPTSNSNNVLPTGQSEPSSLSGDLSDNISCKHEPSSSTTIDNISNIDNNKHEADTSNTPVDMTAAHHHPNSSDRAQDTAATATLAQPSKAESDIISHSIQQHEPRTDISEHAPEAVAFLVCDDSASPTPTSSSLPSSSPSDNAIVEAVTEHPQHIPIEPNHDQRQQPSSLKSSTTTTTATSTTATWITNEEEGESEKGQGIAAERTFSQTPQSIFDEPTSAPTASVIDSKPLPTMAMPMPIPSSSSRLSPLHVQAHASTMADSNSFVSSSSASPSSSSSSSLSDYLIIGQEQVERDDSECDQRSERSYASSRDSYGERYAEDLMYDDASQDSHNESHSPAPSSPPSSHRDIPRRRTSRPSRRSPRPFDKEDDEGERPDLSRTFSEGYAFEQQQQRITESATRSSVRIEDEEEEIPMSSSRPQSRSSTTKTYKRRSNKTTDDSRAAPLATSPVAAAPAAAMPVFKLPTIRGMTKSIVELMVASVVCISLISCMFAFSYISTGANHALGWYSDQQIGQRIRDSLKKREHVLQETLEKMAGEEYVKVKRQSQQYRQHHQQQQQQQARPGSPSPPYGPGGSAYYQNRHQQQYQQQREQRQQQQQQQQQQHQQKPYQDDPDRGRLSTAEWQELIRAASVSFMAKWTTATPNPWTSRR